MNRLQGYDLPSDQIPGLDLVFDAGTGFNHLADHIDRTNPIWLLLITTIMTIKSG